MTSRLVNRVLKDLPRDTADLPLTDSPARRVLGQLAGVLALGCFGSLAAGVRDVAGFYGVRWAPHDLHWISQVQFAASIVTALWLSSVATVRTVRDRDAPRRRWLERTAAVVCSAVLVSTTVSTAWGFGTLSRTVWPAVFACSVAWLAVEVCRAHGVWPDNRFPATAAQRWRAWQIGEWGFVACLVTGSFFALAVELLQWSGTNSVPVMQGDQLSALGRPDFTSIGLGIVSTVAHEDVVVIAATTTLMTAAGRPVREIYALVCLLEIWLHAYFGLPAIGAALFAIGRVWLYLRYRSILPLMVSHALFDSGMFLQGIPLLYRLMLALPVVVAAAWLASRLKAAADRPTPQTPLQSAVICSGGTETAAIRGQGTGIELQGESDRA